MTEAEAAVIRTAKHFTWVVLDVGTYSWRDHVEPIIQACLKLEQEQSHKETKDE